MRFEGKTALVSGAGSGIGRVLAEAFAAEGARVALFGRTRSKLEAVAARLSPNRSVVVEGVHQDPAASESAVSRCVEAFGSLDILVNNAGVYVSGGLKDTTQETWSQALEANLTGPYLLTRAALPELRKSRGVVVNVSSSLGIQPVAGVMAYCAAKAGLNMLTKTTALEEASHGVRVVAVCPGVVDTPIHSQRVGSSPKALEDFYGQMAGAHPLGRIGTPEDVVELITFLASDRASWLTGAIIPIDGGISLV
jgi:NAD(P)-dependent dehydrogenase (short-subunit alcohol dehydrogenase family)